MLRQLMVVMGLLVLAVGAHAQQPGVLPFEPQQLAQALATRAPAWASTELRLDLRGKVLALRLRDLERQVELGDAQGSEAARVVALVVADMALTLAGAAVPAGGSGSAAAAGAPAPGGATPAPSPLARAPERLRFTFDVGVLRGGYSSDQWGWDLGLGASARLRQRWWLAPRLGYWVGPGERVWLTQRLIRFHALSARLLLFVQIAFVELGLGPVLAHYWIHPLAWRGFLPGGCLQAAAWIPLGSAPVKMFTRAQFDVFAVKKDIVVEYPDKVFSTPRFLFGLALGIAWGWS